MSQDGCDDVRSGTDNVIGGFGFGFERDQRRNLVSSTLPIFVEMEDDKFPSESIAYSATNNLLPRRVLRKAKVDTKRDTLVFCCQCMHLDDGAWDMVRRLIVVCFGVG